MKFIHLLFLIISFNYCLAQSRGVITYKTLTVNSSERTAILKSNEQVLAFMKIVDEEIGNNEFLLMFDKNVSHFELKNKVTSDYKKDKMLSDFASQITSRGIYFVDSSTGQILNQFENSGATFLIESNAKDFKWTLTNETKKIGEYICFKATTSYLSINSKGENTVSVTAWYAPKIQIPFGPKNFVGLSGLVLELQERNIVFYASSIDFKPSNKIFIEKPEKGIKITEKEYQKKSSETLSDFKKLIRN